VSDFILRPVVAGDLNFIYHHWLRGLREHDRSALPDDLWFPAHRAAVDRVLADPATVTAVAAASDDHNEILGFAVGRPGEMLHWVHVLTVFRGKGLPLVPALLTEVGCPPGTPAAWQIPSGRTLRNPPRPRSARRFYGTTTTSGSSAKSRSGSPAEPR
jgi:hypothetical protein